MPVNAPNTRVATWCHCQRADFTATASNCRANLRKSTEPPPRGCAAAFRSFRAESRDPIIAEHTCCRFKAEGRDLIIVDTSGRHKQSEALFEEMRAVAAGVAPVGLKG